MPKEAAARTVVGQSGGPHNAFGAIFDGELSVGVAHVGENPAWANAIDLDIAMLEFVGEEPVELEFLPDAFNEVRDAELVSSAPWRSRASR